MLYLDHQVFIIIISYMSQNMLFVFNYIDFSQHNNNYVYSL